MNLSTPETQQHRPETSVRDVLHVLFKHKRAILGIFFVAVASVTLGVFLLPPVYEATASVLIKIGREYLPKPDVGAGGNLLSVNQQEIINSEIAILNSRDVIGKVINALGVDRIYPKIARDPPRNMTPFDAALVEFAKDLRTDDVKKSSVINVSFRNRDPVVAAKALTLLIGFYKEKHLQVFANAESSFLKEQMAEYQRRLHESEQALETFKQDNKVYSVEEQRSLLLKQRVDLDTSLKSANDRVSALKREVSSYRQHLSDIAKDKAQYTQSELDKILVDARTRLLSLQIKEQELLAKDYRSDSRSVKDVRKEIWVVKSFLNSQEDNIRHTVRTSNPVYQEVQKQLLKAQADLASQQAGAATLSEQIAQLDRQIRSLDEKQNELSNLKRALSINEKNYLTYAEKHEEARISDDLNRQKIANISVVQAPSIPKKPVEPKKRLDIFLAIILGGIFGVGYAFLLEFISHGLSTPQQVEDRLGHRVLVSIPLKQQV
jgi:uncharacterized protein involved in exopolysaccharide biosynthesis